MQTIWNGTVDNLELSGQPNGDRQPMRVVEDEDGRLMTEFASASEDEDGSIAYDTCTWCSDYQIRFRDMDPEPSPNLLARMAAQNLVDL